MGRLTDALVDRVAPTPEWEDAIVADDPTLELARDVMENPETVTLRDGRQLGYADVGDPDGTPLVVFHGFPNSRVFGVVFDAIGREQGVRILAPDRPGFGVSDPDPDRRLLDWPTDLADFLDGLGLDSSPVLGVSGGGPYAAASAALLPERVDHAGIASGLGPMAAVGVRDRLWYYTARGAGPLTKLLLWAAGRQALVDRDAFLQSLAESRSDADAAHWTGTVGKVTHASMIEARRHHGLAPLVTETALFGRPWGVDLSAIEVPVTLWYGGADTVVPPAMGRYLADRIPTATEHYGPDLGHLSAFVENEREIVETLTA